MRTPIIGGVAALALAVAAGGALAQSQPQGQIQGQTQAPASPRAHALRGDADRDGRLSQAEFVEGRAARLAAVDANRDGSVTRDEMQAAMQARRAQRADQRFAKLDANGDGSITRAEFDAGHAARGDHPRPHRAMRRMGGHRGPHAQPARERGPVVIAEVRARAAERFAKLDVDGDGFVTAQEQRTARQAQVQQRRAQRQARRQSQPSPQAPVSE